MPIIREANNVEVSVLDSVCLQWGKKITCISEWKGEMKEGGRKEESEKQVKLKLGGRMTYHIIFTLICPVAKHWRREGDKSILYWNLATCLTASQYPDYIRASFQDLPTASFWFVHRNKGRRNGWFMSSRECRHWWALIRNHWTLGRSGSSTLIHVLEMKMRCK